MATAGPKPSSRRASTFCYGNTGTSFWLLNKQTSGRLEGPVISHRRWRNSVINTGADRMAGYLRRRSGCFCFPVVRWIGMASVQNRFEYDGRPASFPSERLMDGPRRA